MPCMVTEAEAQHYERETNEKTYGLRQLSERITATGACELGRILRERGLLEGTASDLAMKWLEIHAEDDAHPCTGCARTGATYEHDGQVFCSEECARAYTAAARD